ncbi:MarR family winged helix-turn-helix transcriptional regulator [Streptomyces sp. NBC_01478]|jgi:DNA-binding MarR family transcriptional regulator|uniref:MarR family winged helix-turn-helix transcriptional regulator n=1 Tax=Streptomyces sp. NBC_01478 TaxID=2903882 RepID=UPI002E364414|nr:MarR family winged helix-turn-helix transcriptional regulator [Streptomyces sp. NBC_01478]
MSSVPSPGLAHLLSHAERRMGLRMAAMLAEENCSVEQWRVLSVIADGKGHPMTEIADQVLMPAPSLTKLVDRMVADNLVFRRPDRADRRRVLLHLTARGRALHQRAAHRLLADQTRLLDAIDDHGDLVRLLARLTAALDQEPAHPGGDESAEKILPVS